MRARHYFNVKNRSYTYCVWYFAPSKHTTRMFWSRPSPTGTFHQETLQSNSLSHYMSQYSMKRIKHLFSWGLFPEQARRLWEGELQWMCSFVSHYKFAFEELHSNRYRSNDPIATTTSILIYTTPRSLRCSRPLDSPRAKIRKRKGPNRKFNLRPPLVDEWIKSDV